MRDGENTKVLVPHNSRPNKVAIERIDPYGKEPSDTIHQANLTLALVDRGLSARDIALLMKAQANSSVQISKAKNDIIISNNNERNKKYAFAVSTMAMFTPLIPGIDMVVGYSIASIGAVGFATSLYSFFGAKAFEAGKKFRNLFHR
ncbi:MAG: hypothetical protein HQK72_00865 [Desulfamplus sp.]|nr:hypothetical protein [Desulfamplus sp.]